MHLRYCCFWLPASRWIRGQRSDRRHRRKTQLLSSCYEEASGIHANVLAAQESVTHRTANAALPFLEEEEDDDCLGAVRLYNMIIHDNENPKLNE